MLDYDGSMFRNPVTERQRASAPFITVSGGQLDANGEDIAVL